MYLRLESRRYVYIYILLAACRVAQRRRWDRHRVHHQPANACRLDAGWVPCPGKAVIAREVRGLPGAERYATGQIREG